jgi:hypothetical protein
MSEIFKDLELKAFRAGITPRTRESRKWFMKKAGAMRSINKLAIIDDEVLIKTSKNKVGTMQMFFYDPKHKKTLPYYDAFPLIIVVGPAAGGFYGINLHYLPPVLRLRFLDALMNVVESKNTDNAKFAITYKMLVKSSKLKYFEPAFKHYLTGHVKSRFAQVNSPEWEIATFLPLASFKKASKQTVYRDSRKKIGRV